MRCLLDGDIILYEVGFKGQFKDEETGEIIPRDFDTTAGYLDEMIRQIEAECWATEPSTIFLTGKGNFRDEIATVKGYKEHRPKDRKPFHYNNLKAYMKANYDVRWQDGLEADDLLAIEQKKAEPLTTIICTRDKDLRMVEGMHFGWASGNQPQYGPRRVEKLGELELINQKKIVGNGLKFFYSQLITGDSTDNIPGLPRGGPTLAFKTLGDTTTEGEMFNAVRELYRKRYEDEGDERMLEQAQLLWMVDELDEEGKPVMWRFPRDDEEYDNRDDDEED